MIHGILGNLGFKSTVHEPCLYLGKIGNETLFLLWKVDDFAISTSTVSLGKDLLSRIQLHLQKPIKHLGVLEMYNCLDISQTNIFIKVNCATYLQKGLQSHGLLSDSHHPVPTSMQINAAFHERLNTSSGPDTPE